MDHVVGLVARAALEPAKAPPNGVKSNFMNPVSRQHELIEANAACLAVALLFLSMRLWTRISVTRSLGWDDYTAILAMVFIVAHSAGTLKVLDFGLGMHMWDIPKTRYDKPNYLKWNVVMYMMYIAAMGTVKVSILLLYLRLFARNRITKYSTYACLVFVGAYSLACELSVGFGCRPLRKRFAKEIPGSCIDFQRLILVQNCLNIVSDAFMVLIPIPAAWALQLPRRQKIGVIAIFATASVVCVASAIRLHHIAYPPSRGDGTWGQFDGTLWSVIELNLAIICSCMPAFKPFIQHYAPWLKHVSSRILSSKGKSSVPTGSEASKVSASGTFSKSSGNAKEEFIELHDEENPPYLSHQSPKQQIIVQTRVMSESTERIVEPRS